MVFADSSAGHLVFDLSLKNEETALYTRPFHKLLDALVLEERLELFIIVRVKLVPKLTRIRVQLSKKKYYRIHEAFGTLI